MTKDREFEDKKQQLMKVNLEAEMYGHYVKIIDKMLKWCVFEQPEDIEARIIPFGVDKRALTLRACREVLERWEDEGDEKRTKKT